MAVRSVAARVKVADQIWIATALLHRENPERQTFSAAEIVTRVRREFGRLMPGVYPHIYGHAVANVAPTTGRYRILYRTNEGWRLFRRWDDYDPDREGGKERPRPDEIPEEYWPLLEWYDETYSPPIKLFGPDALRLLLRLKTASSGLSDVSENHDRYLADAYMHWKQD